MPSGGTRNLPRRDRTWTGWVCALSVREAHGPGEGGRAALSSPPNGAGGLRSHTPSEPDRLNEWVNPKAGVHGAICRK